jgi:flagellar hook-basal body complex protein FliE
MDATALVASRAYGAAVSQAAGAREASGAVAPQNFGALIESQLAQVAEQSRAVETQASAVATGRAELVDVVTAIAAAEIQLETMIAIRDQVVQAYQEIQRMPI